MSSYHIDALSGQIIKDNKPLKKKADIEKALQEIVLTEIANGGSIEDLSLNEETMPTASAILYWFEENDELKAKMKVAQRKRLLLNQERFHQAANRFAQSGNKTDKEIKDACREILEQLDKMKQDEDLVVNLTVDRVMPEDTWK